MRHVKPQSALVSTINTQIGAQPMLAVSIGVGFRLDQPSILVHEAAVWEALKAAAPSMPLFEAALPKQRAEWLLAGHASHPVARGTRARHVDWTAWVELDGVRKIVSCATQLDDTQPEEGFARLAIDHRYAAAGGARENPLGVTSGTPPLQQVRTFGAGPAPLAAMGAIGTDWPERVQWMPPRAGTAGAMADDGTHMGWPASVDRRFFQQAAPDQWARGEAWASGARFELAAFGPRGEGYAGELPRLAPIALVTHTGRPDIERLALRQQTVWFLPDRGIGVLWWNGMSALDFLLDDSPSMLVTAFRDSSESVDVDAVMEFAARRTDLNCADPLQYADHELMPSIANGWTWEMILGGDDHPRFAPASRDYDELRERVDEHRKQLLELRDARQRLDAFSAESRDVTLPEAPHGDANWRDRLSDAQTRELADVTIRDADLSSMRFDGWKLEDVRFERCRFDRSEWSGCDFTRVHATDCSFAGVKMNDGRWKGGHLRCCSLAGSEWTNAVFEQISIDECTLDDLKASGGAWSMTSLQGCSGARGVIENVKWDSISWSDVSAPDWTWVRVRADGFAIVECDMAGLAVSRCTLGKLSVLSSDLSRSNWQRNVMTFAVLSLGTSMSEARLVDCAFRSSSLLELHADRIRVDHCSFIQLNAQHLRASQSHWSESELDGANMMHAQLAQASFVRCSLTEAMLYGANLRESQMHDCNLARARLSWSEPPDPGAWRHNLTTGLVDVPGRAG
ncbi:uncharacterized protein YjbI with pentapeptide repeats [Paraburkholderia sp. HC6.4b]|uniref:DUF2169 family type VI secretion system accessory protein n=1 Tax=unclassified Paraburkholderia TaxID=2615204 RepID=UPI001620AC35|nr:MULTISPECIES: DUF2169 domain-containing protein [unclassified Paraburkholderia]MBB5413883.1 uncharacterized protein YjbI with pentapeptide repeats [Paraburkholderia sp. HC6.4b]MBB5456307.1 uncharacterized protein YjbI with pentapeptide repeats [Paraburkholderia sp. Kb1A]